MDDTRELGYTTTRTGQRVSAQGFMDGGMRAHHLARRGSIDFGWEVSQSSWTIAEGLLTEIRTPGIDAGRVNCPS